MSSSRKNGRKIMIVEDEMVIAADLEMRLRDLGYTVTAIADSAESAMQGIETELPDLVFVDIRIRGPLDGVDLAMQIKRRYRLPVIFLTAHADRFTLERAKLTEPYGFLVKPISSAHLPGAIEIAFYKHRIEQELRQQKAWFETTLRSIGDAILVTSMDQRVCYVNEIASHLIGSPGEQCLNRSFSEVFRLFHEGTNLPVENFFQAAMESDVPVPLPRDVYLVGHGGGRFCVEGTVAISQRHAERFGAVVSFRDRTLQQVEELERCEDEKMIAVGRLAGGISTGFMNLTSAIADCSGGLRQPAAQLDVGSIADRLDALAQKAAAFACQLQSLVEKDDVHLEPVELSAFIRKHVQRMRRVLGASTVIATAFDDGGEIVRTDTGQLGQVMTNLILNAQQSMCGPGTIHVRTSRVPAGSFDGLFKEDYVWIEVCYQGAGTPDRAMQHIFEPFFVGSDSDLLSGLELASVRNLVTNLGGFLHADCCAGGGLIFKIFLPKSYVQPS